MPNSHESPRQTGRNKHEVGETSGARRQPRRSASRRTRQSNAEVFRTPVLNLAAAAKIADSLQPTHSEAGRGIEQIRALLHTAQQQNSAVSQSLQDPIVTFARTHIGQFIAPVLISDTGEAAVP
ncbi:hypothetical protein ZWY2020_010105 [Hordeum vulgare]|nr:hypothetical protein ZWY2020_010105 [Hordeum vulgare]